MKKEETLRSNLVSAISVISELLKNDTYDYTHQFWSTFIWTAKNYLDEAEKLIK
jgi:hypothetical protein